MRNIRSLIVAGLFLIATPAFAQTAPAASVPTCVNGKPVCQTAAEKRAAAKAEREARKAARQAEKEARAKLRAGEFNDMDDAAKAAGLASIAKQVAQLTQRTTTLEESDAAQDNALKQQATLVAEQGRDIAKLKADAKAAALAIAALQARPLPKDGRDGKLIVRVHCPPGATCPVQAINASGGKIDAK